MMTRDPAVAWLDVADSQSEPPKWVIDGVLPVGLTVIGAPPKSKKSVITMALSALTAEVECRALPPDIRVVPDRTGPVIALSAEHDAGELKSMFEAMGVSMPFGRIYAAFDPDDFMLDDRESLNDLLAWLDDLQPRMLIIDPLRDFHVGEEDDSGHMVRLLRPLRKWAKAQDNEAAVVVVHHSRKINEPGAKTTAMDLRGSSAIFGKVDGLLTITPSALEDVVEVSGKFKRGRAWTRIIKLGVPGFGWSEVGSYVEPQIAKGKSAK